MKFGMGTRGHGMLEGMEARDEIWHGDTVARGHGMLEGTGARMARRARNLSDSSASHRRKLITTQ